MCGTWIASSRSEVLLMTAAIKADRDRADATSCDRPESALTYPYS